ncbi:glycosyltransferase family 4 protein [Thalassoglobus polymorphus]|uniref:GDP-mannose-dependent alpha-(1-6)-phosphatidylinositol monomannoside mannosyltransferase n=1 Tax=Thalassoglobus polymorphus TaxID=2527994 RepID=A0A517QSP6_9PLAN|nr:glycosyltransferase family 4 protein [Thalassoglobus polymorphus]QDT34645.1 GDP-mannose-dependent alpha-(1-6)-phosphatidylinositol monomannoside mannosyltransferase [Thalassoglobus polymorphus]
MKKILLLSEVFPPQNGGSGRWFWEIYSRLNREQVCIAAGEHEGAEEFDRQHELNVERLPLTLSTWGVASWSGFNGYWRIFKRVLKVVRREKITMIHAGRCLPEAVVAMAVKKLKGTPYVFYVHGEDVNTAWSSRELTFLVRRALNSATYCIANSQNTARLLQEDWGLPAEKIQVLHPGVDTQRFMPEERSLSIRESLGWGDRTVILTVGRLQKRKGQDMLIRALPAIREQFPDVLYSIVGDGAQRESLERLAEELGVKESLQFQGETTDEELAACYRQCDLFALPNREIDGDIEGFGMVLLEAQASGRPVLAGDSGGTAETMDIDKTGVIADCTSPEPLAEAILKLLNDEARREQMGREARGWVVSQFDWSALARQAGELFGVEVVAGLEGCSVAEGSEVASDAN